MRKSGVQRCFQKVIKHPITVFSAVSILAMFFSYESYKLLCIVFATHLSAESIMLIIGISYFSIGSKYLIEQKRRKEALKIREEWYRMIIDTASMGIWDWDLKTHKIYYSSKITEVFNCKSKEDKWRMNVDCVHPDDQSSIAKITDLFTEGMLDHYDCECRMLNRQNEYVWVYVIVQVLRNEKGNIIRLMGALTDIHQKKLNEERIRYLAYYDELTGLPNRAYLKEQFNKQKDHYEPMACIYLDVDNFKVVNESFSHECGDNVLIEISKRLSSVANAQVIVSRIVVDEFGILLKGIRDAEDIKHFVQKIEEGFKGIFTVNTIKFGISFSIGIAIYPKDGETFDELLNHANTAMNQAKDKGKRTYVFFSNTFKESTREKIYMESDLRQAILNNELVLYYQPQMETATGKLIGFEALMRWIKKDNTIIPPDKFIRVAEETGLMIPIGTWAIKEACFFINKLKNQGYKELYVAVNISVLQLGENNFVEKVEEILQETKVDARKLHIEITETMLMESLEISVEKLEKIQQKGISISLDDFGKGYSSLTYLKQLPLNVLKIEKAFIDDIIKKDSKNIVGAIINLGHKLELEVVAEGVEEESQLEYLKLYHCDIVQGYLFSKPIPENEVIKFLQKLGE